ncbi:hypothetical protein SELMODRAFT_420253 [Selaginella moellendorffii]|uniref:S-protein homolog n=1 Tax=Selaginella moellendorffii TaxID=88036 RepID=D8SBE9_SELML|nr:hypothetical protein SELMODRAFT_420253 [Selaginella moellendorffii]
MTAAAEAKTVKIFNRSESDLSLHCRSKQNDLGAQTLKPKDSFGWPFGDRWVGNTLFWCDFSLDGGNRSGSHEGKGEDESTSRLEDMYEKRGVSREEVWKQLDALLEQWKDDIVQFHFNGLTTLFSLGELKFDLHKPRFRKIYRGTQCNFYNLVIEDGFLVHASIHVAEGHYYGPEKIAEAFRASLATQKTAVLLPPYLDPDSNPILEDDIIFQEKLSVQR